MLDESFFFLLSSFFSQNFFIHSNHGHTPSNLHLHIHLHIHIFLFPPPLRKKTSQVASHRIAYPSHRIASYIHIHIHILIHILGIRFGSVRFMHTLVRGKIFLVSFFLFLSFFWRWEGEGEGGGGGKKIFFFLDFNTRSEEGGGKD